MRVVPSRGRDSPAVLNRALDLGVTFLDTADLYSDGRNGELIGRVVRARWEEVVLGTKFGALRHPGGEMYLRGNPAYVRGACEASLQTSDLFRVNAIALAIYRLVLGTNRVEFVRGCPSPPGCAMIATRFGTHSRRCRPRCPRPPVFG